MEFLFIPLILVVGYLLLIRPQQRRVRLQQQLLSSISEGDEVVTAGGMVGRVSALVGEDRLELEVAPGTKVVFLRHAVTGRTASPQEDAEDGEGTAEDAADAAEDGATGSGAGGENGAGPNGARPSGATGAAGASGATGPAEGGGSGDAG
jgi:preprotein translocase subunit YajC